MSKVEDFNFDDYIKNTHILGRLFLIIGIFLLLGAPFFIAKVTGAHIDWNGFSKSIVKIILIYVPSSIVEFLIYVPMLGVGSVYLTFLTGNITNLKIPCAFSAREIAKTKVGTKEDEIIMSLSIATSALVTMSVIALGVALIVPLTPVLQNPTLKPAFDNVLPALFGALGYQYFIKDLRLSFISMLIMVAFSSAIPTLIGQTGTMIIVIGAITISIAYIFFRISQSKLKKSKN